MITIIYGCIFTAFLVFAAWSLSYFTTDDN